MHLYRCQQSNSCNYPRYFAVAFFVKTTTYFIHFLSNKNRVLTSIRNIKKHKLATITIAYWFLLVYIVVALVFWYLELQRQNNQMYHYRVEQLERSQVGFAQQLMLIEDEKRRKTSQYIGEGSTFLLLILVGAVFVFRATRKQLRLSQQQQNFMMAVTHEFKTPIAITRLNLETLQKRKLEEAQQQKLIGNTLQETNRLNSLTNNILVASQLEAGAYSVNKQWLDISELAEEIVKEYSSRFQQRSIQSRIEPGIEIKGESFLLQMLISNLLDNAIKYSDKESTVSVQLYKRNAHVILSVSDEGIGIATAEKKKVFDKFYRIGSEETRTTKGTGLGLYICFQIVRSLGGNITITDNNPKGSIFTVRI